jgi:hypothetical protein
MNAERQAAGGRRRRSAFPAGARGRHSSWATRRSAAGRCPGRGTERRADQ